MGGRTFFLVIRLDRKTALKLLSSRHNKHFSYQPGCPIGHYLTWVLFLFLDLIWYYMDNLHYMTHNWASIVDFNYFHYLAVQGPYLPWPAPRTRPPGWQWPLPCHHCWQHWPPSARASSRESSSSLSSSSWNDISEKGRHLHFGIHWVKNVMI